MKMKFILPSLLLVAISACASMESKESVHLMDGSTLFITDGKAVRIVDSTGKTVAVEKGAMVERADGRVIYIQPDGEVKNLKSGGHSNTHNSKKSSGHSH